MSDKNNKITITLSDSALIEVVKLLSTTTPTGTAINPMALLGALGGLPKPPFPNKKLEEKSTEEKPTIGFKLKGK